MIKADNEINKYKLSDLDDKLKREYAKSLSNEEFKKILRKLKIKDSIAYKYTSKIERTMNELNNCKGCKSLYTCKNKVCGMVYYPDVLDDSLVFNYVACKFKKEDIKNKEEIKTTFFEMPLEIRMARMSNIDVSDAKRVKVIKWLKKFFDDYKAGKRSKGLYLHGSFGSGKTYLVSALLNELSKDNVKTLVVYYPELLRSIKETFNLGESLFSDRIKEIKTADILLLDDIGAETVTGWNRDEILGTILQYRMEEKLPTFFTSNLTIEELEEHFVINKSAEEQIKSKRIIERVKQLTDREELISNNRRS